MSNTPARPRSQRTITALSAALCLLAVLGFWFEARGFFAKTLAFHAQALAESGQDTAALSEAERAIRNNPYDSAALRLRVIKFKDATRWADMESAVAPLLLVSPNQGVAYRLAAEAAIRTGATDTARERMALALWINPHPPTGPANYWRAMMGLSEQTGKQNEALAAALRTVEFTADDPLVNSVSRGNLMNEAAGVLQRAGLNRTAAHLQNAGRAAAKTN